jgi:hypothetical protein
VFWKDRIACSYDELRPMEDIGGVDVPSQGHALAAAIITRAGS